MQRIGKNPASIHSGRIVSVVHTVMAFAKKNAVMLIALLAAVVTSCIIPPDEAYLDYFDYKTLTCLFCVLAVVCALKNIRFFYMLARKIVELFKNARMAVLGLVYITFIGSMLIANDMALLTFLPLGFLVLTTTDKRKYMAVTFILQNIAANLGGMLTPFGNPQNLYLYSKFTIPTLEFMGIMAPPFVLSIALVTVCCFLFVKAEPLQLGDEKIKMPPIRTAIYLLLFAFSIVIVFRWIPYWTGLIVIPAALLIMVLTKKTA
jgi:Na+/H+ antiporter NhaD/arsenite permease-like protein